MLSTDRRPVTDPDGVRWNGGAWFGGLIGGTAWMLTAAASYGWQAPWLGVGFLAAFLGTNALGVWVWVNRNRFRFFRSAQVMTALWGGLALATLLAFDVLGPVGLRHDLVWGASRPAWVGADRSEFRSAYVVLAVLIPVLLVQFEVQARRARRRASPTAD